MLIAPYSGGVMPSAAQFRAMHHQLAADLDLGGKPGDPVADDRIIDERRRVAVPRHDVARATLEGVRDLQHDAAADQAALDRRAPRSAPSIRH